MSDPVGLYVDLADGQQPPAEGWWVATRPGSRYLVLSARKVVPRDPTSRRRRWALRCVRLERHAEIPDDVRVVWLSWYPRRRNRSANRRG